MRATQNLFGSRSHRYRSDPAALAEYENAVLYYAAERSELGRNFIESFEDAIARICAAPDRWRVFAGREVRRAFMHKFPYAVLYTIEPDHVLVVAVAHYSREPGYWRERLP